jgi:hypothetical protein
MGFLIVINSTVKRIFLVNKFIVYIIDTKMCLKIPTVNSTELFNNNSNVLLLLLIPLSIQLQYYLVLLYIYTQSYLHMIQSIDINIFKGFLEQYVG